MLDMAIPSSHYCMMVYSENEAASFALIALILSIREYRAIMETSIGLTTNFPLSGLYKFWKQVAASLNYSAIEFVHIRNFCEC